MKNKIKIPLALVASLISYEALACPIDMATPPIYVANATSVHTNILSKQIDAANLAMNVALAAQTKAIAEAITVWTAQKGVSAQQEATAIKNNTQVEATAIQAISTNERIKEALRNYGDRSVGYKPCNVSKNRTDIMIATQNTEQNVPMMIKTEVTAAPGTYSPKLQAMATRLALHEKKYCTASQVASGLCTVEGEYAGASLMAQTLFKPTTKDSEDYQAQSAFINNMVGLPDDPLPKNTANSALGQSYGDKKRHKDALISTAINSLKSIQASWSVSSDPEDQSSPSGAPVTTEKQQVQNKTATPNTAKSMVASLGSATSSTASATASSTAGSSKSDEPQPVMVQLKGEVDRYLGGGKEYQDWSKSLAGMEEKGVLTELLKIKALRLYMQTEQYKHLSRLEAMLAANVSMQMENGGLNGRVEMQRQLALRSAMRDKMVK